MRNQTSFQTVDNIVDLKQSRLSTHSQCSVKILNIAQMAIALLLLKLNMGMDHIITYSMIYLVLLYLQD